MPVVDFVPGEGVLGDVLVGGTLAKVAVDELVPDFSGALGDLGGVFFEFFLCGVLILVLLWEDWGGGAYELGRGGDFEEDWTEELVFEVTNVIHGWG